MNADICALESDLFAEKVAESVQRHHDIILFREQALIGKHCLYCVFVRLIVLVIELDLIAFFQFQVFFINS